MGKKVLVKNCCKIESGREVWVGFWCHLSDWDCDEGCSRFKLARVLIRTFGVSTGSMFGELAALVVLCQEEASFWGAVSLFLVFSGRVTGLEVCEIILLEIIRVRRFINFDIISIQFTIVSVSFSSCDSMLFDFVVNTLMAFFSVTGCVSEATIDARVLWC